MSMAAITHLADVREKKRQAALPKVFSCGKCQEQAAKLMPDKTIRCGRVEPEKCTARMAADWYLDAALKNSLPRLKFIAGEDRYVCGRCSFPFFHMQEDGSLTCFREGCKTTATFRWQWHVDAEV